MDIFTFDNMTTLLYLLLFFKFFHIFSSTIQYAGKLKTITKQVPIIKTSLDVEGDRMKTYEPIDDTPPYQSFCVRADGHGFSKLTKQFPKNPSPFDPGFQSAIVRTGNDLMNIFCASSVFTCSDEITIVFPALCTKTQYYELISTGVKNLPSHKFSGRQTKIATLVAANCSLLFNKYLTEEIKKDQNGRYSEIVKTIINNKTAIFDARCIVFPVGKDMEIFHILRWRAGDSSRNAISTHARHKTDAKKCYKQNCNAMITMMMDSGFNYDTEVPLCNKYGVFGKKILVNKSNEKGDYTRTQMYNFSTDIRLQDPQKTLELITDKYFTNDKINSIEFLFGVSNQ